MRRPTGLRSGSSRLQDVERDSHEVEWSKRLPEASLLFSADLGTRFSMGSMGTLVLLSKSLINSVQSMNSSLFPEPYFIPAASVEKHRCGCDLCHRLSTPSSGTFLASIHVWHHSLYQHLNKHSDLCPYLGTTHLRKSLGLQDDLCHIVAPLTSAIQSIRKSHIATVLFNLSSSILSTRLNVLIIASFATLAARSRPHAVPAAYL